MRESQAVRLENGWLIQHHHAHTRLTPRPLELWSRNTRPRQACLGNGDQIQMAESQMLHRGRPPGVLRLLSITRVQQRHKSSMTDADMGCQHGQML